MLYISVREVAALIERKKMYLFVFLVNKYDFFFYVTNKRGLNAPPDAVPALRLTSRVGKVERSMAGTGQTITSIMIFIKFIKSPGRQ